MKRIGIFCDGTWQSSDSQDLSNVMKLAQSLRATASDGVGQEVYYVAGVGTGQGRDRLSAGFDKYTGGALGWGLDLAIETAYRALMLSYQPGDEVYVFGFSRGAYTARSLVGLIRRAGIMLPVHEGQIKKAMQFYRTRDDARTKPDSPEMMAFRADHSPATATSLAELEWRRQTGRPVPAKRFRVAFLGVWDTVGSLGVPGYFTAAPLFNRKYLFHDTDLSSMVQTARHAVAVDERRLSFEPTLWTNLSLLNRAELGAPTDAEVAARPIEDLPYRQEWFPGDHGSVGGGNPRTGLSSYACEWMAEGATKAGLEFAPQKLDSIRAQRKIGDPLISMSESWLSRFWRLADREGPLDPRDVSTAAQERIRAFRDYAPPTLANVIRAFRTGG
jgi:uncharacterized protein (DUF2235 family)